MRNLFADLSARIKRLFACLLLASSASTAAPVQQETWLDYYPYRDRVAAQIWGSVPPTPPEAYTMWVNAPLAFPLSETAWSRSGPTWDSTAAAWEVMETDRDCGYGTKVTWLRGYRDAGGMYPLRAIKVTYVDEGTGAEFDMTACAGVNPATATGHIYSLDNMPASPYRLKVWGEVWAGGVVVNTFYWETTFEMKDAVVNPCTGEARRALVQREVWWDNAGYRVGSGSAPFDGFGRPQAVRDVVFPGFVAVAKGAGVLWRGESKLATGEVFVSCMQFRWEY